MKDVRVAVEASANSFATYRRNKRVSKRTVPSLAPRPLPPNRKAPYLCDSADILIAIRLREAQILVQAKAHVIAIKTVCANAKVEQVLLKRGRDRRLSRRRETREPDRVSLLPAKGLALAAA